MAQQAKKGDTVAVHYTGRLEDGTVFDTSREGDPVEFELGSETVIDGFDDAVEGMEIGEERNAQIPPDRAYGQRRDDLEVQVPRERLPEGAEPAEGQMLEVQVAPGRNTVARITDVGDEEVTLDLNHPLAGHELDFDIELMEIQQ